MKCLRTLKADADSDGNLGQHLERSLRRLSSLSLSRLSRRLSRLSRRLSGLSRRLGLSGRLGRRLGRRLSRRLSSHLSHCRSSPQNKHTPQSTQRNRDRSGHGRRS